MEKQDNKVIVEHREASKDQDSLSIGSASKGGIVKIYLNFNEPEACKTKIDEAVKLRKYLQEGIEQ